MNQRTLKKQHQRIRELKSSLEESSLPASAIFKANRALDWALEIVSGVVATAVTGGYFAAVKLASKAVRELESGYDKATQEDVNRELIEAIDVIFEGLVVAKAFLPMAYVTFKVGLQTPAALQAQGVTSIVDVNANKMDIVLLDEIPAPDEVIAITNPSCIDVVAVNKQSISLSCPTGFDGQIKVMLQRMSVH